MSFYKRRDHFLVSFKDRKLDLADTLMLNWNKPSRTIYLGVSRKTAAGGNWNEEQVLRTEERIRFDLNFDGYGVSIERLSSIDELLLEAEFLLKLRIRLRWA